MTHAFGNGGGSASKRGPDRGATRRTRRDGRVDRAHWPKCGSVTPEQKGGPANSYLAGSHFCCQDDTCRSGSSPNSAGHLGQLEPRHRAAPVARLEPDPAAVRLDDALAGGQAYAVTLHIDLPRALLEGEHVGGLPDRDPHPAVGDLDPPPGLAPP